jgi:hypothetical protein
MLLADISGAHPRITAAPICDRVRQQLLIDALVPGVAKLNGLDGTGFGAIGKQRMRVCYGRCPKRKYRRSAVRC